nr:MAG TPA: hypothetical protein [Caudoviricetes sp.]
MLLSIDFCKIMLYNIYINKNKIYKSYGGN